MDEVNGVRIQGDSATARAFMAACRELGAIEVLGPSNDPAGHSDHIHCAW
jgi:zinc D-Ala-D-Ala carboxypeptidase